MRLSPVDCQFDVRSFAAAVLVKIGAACFHFVAIATHNRNGSVHAPGPGYATATATEAGGETNDAVYSVVSREGRGADTDRGVNSGGGSYELATPTTALDASAHTQHPFLETSFVLAGHTPVGGAASPADRDDGGYLLTGAEAEGNEDELIMNDFV